MPWKIDYRMTAADDADDETRDMVARGAYGDVWVGEWFDFDHRDLIDQAFESQSEAEAALGILKAHYWGADALGVDVHPYVAEYA